MDAATGRAWLKLVEIAREIAQRREVARELEAVNDCTR